MAGVAHTVELDSREVQAALARLSPDLLAQMADDIGALVEDQTRRRVRHEKASPEGAAWPAWSEAYAAQMAARKLTARSLLVGGEDLHDSIQRIVTDTTVEVGSNLPYAAIHQFGGAKEGGVGGIPARPYLGLSIENRSELEDLVISRLEEMLQ